MACKKAQQRNINPAVMWGAVNTNNVTARKGKCAANDNYNNNKSQQQIKVIQCHISEDNGIGEGSSPSAALKLNKMTHKVKSFYFRKTGGYSFPMEVTINDDRHEANFLAVMKRKGFHQVDEDYFQQEERIKSAFNTMFFNR